MQIIKVGKTLPVKTINEAIDLVTEETIIYLKSGFYYEKIKLNKNNVKIIGEDPEKTIISFDDYALKIHKDGKEYNTFRTYTMFVLANNITLENLTIENTSGEGQVVGQAVALGTTGNNIFINNCILRAHQDTLFVGPLPKDLIVRYQNFLPNDELIFPEPHNVYINKSKIIGDVDFIFGAGTCFIDNCEIISLKRDGFVCAPSTEITDNEGFVFTNCYFRCEYRDTKVFLARPWRDYGMAKFINCTYQNHILDLGFDKWNDTSRDKTARFYEVNGKYEDNHQFTRAYFCKTISK